MRLSWKLGRVAGIDLYLHATFLIMLAVMALAGHGPLGVLLVASLFGCVLLHEFGHALTARRFGIPTEDITLYPIGGIARLHRMPRAPGAELLIALAGPAVNVGIALALASALGLIGVFLPALSVGPLADALRQLLVINVILAGFNLIPAFPMDGGRVLRALLSGRFGRLRATEVAATIGQVLAIVFAVYCVSSGLWLQAILAVFIYVVAGAELGQVRAEERRRHRADPIGGAAPPGYSWIYRGNGVWQLAPAVVVDEWADRPFRSPRPWL